MSQKIQVGDIKKEIDTGFSMFEKIFDQFVKENVLSLLEETDQSSSLEKRVYDILISYLFHMNSRLLCMETSISTEARDYYLTIGDVFCKSFIHKIAKEKYTTMQPEIIL